MSQQLEGKTMEPAKVVLMSNDPPQADSRSLSVRPRGDPRRQWIQLRREIPAWTYHLLAATSFLSLFLIWTWLSHQTFVNKIFLPTPETVWKTGLTFLGEQNFYTDVRISVFRVTAGFLMAAAAALPIGVFMGSFKVMEGLLQPLTEFIRYVPVPALIPMLMLLFGIGEEAKIMLIFVGTFFQLVLMVADEIRRVPYELLQVSYTMGARRGEAIRLVLFRAALPGIFDALRLCNGWAWTYLVVSELIAANEGLGYRILKFSRFVQTPKIFVYLIFLGVLGLLIDFLFRKLNQRLFHWADTTKR
ncbi:MAG TPA: ABC transporter permease [Candidatus Saccharimonadales bacterium]|nr:ABC transporter permease [Candidatus Saccharimonadales bacterium]